MKTTSANLNRTNTITSVFGKMLDNMRLFFFFSFRNNGQGRFAWGSDHRPFL